MPPHQRRHDNGFGRGNVRRETGTGRGAWLPPLVACTVLAVACPTALAHPAEHADEHESARSTRLVRSSASYALPNVAMMRADGAKVSFPGEIEDGKPILLHFIFTSCTAVCPLMSQVFSEVQAKLGEERKRVRMVSISIDPEHDNPARLAEHARKFGAGPQWQHYTGSAEASVALQRAFQVYRGDKMNHLPITFLRVAPGHPWTRLEGFASAEEVIREYRNLVAR